MKLTTHARESQATSLCHRENIQKSLQRLYTLVYLISIIASYKYGITRLIIAKDIQKEHGNSAII